jgi:hypothetical protein
MIGIDLTSVTAGTTTDGAGAKYTLGTRVTGSQNGEWIYVQAAEAISTTVKQPLCLTIDEAFQAKKAIEANVLAGHIIAVAPTQIIADNAFFWAQTRGICSLRVAAACAADVNLWVVAGSAGRLDDTSGATGSVVLGIKITAAASASTSEGNTVRTAIITNTLSPQLIA